MRPWTRHRLWPQPGTWSELTLAPTWALELAGGGQLGIRLGLAQDDAANLPLEKTGATIPLLGTERVWIWWPADVDQARFLDLVAWHVREAGYARDQGGVVRAADVAHYVAQASAFNIAGGGTSHFIPGAATFFENLPNFTVPPEGIVLPMTKGTRLSGLVYANGSLSWHVDLVANNAAGGLLEVARFTSEATSSPTRRAVNLLGVPAPPARWRLVITNVDAAAQFWWLVGTLT